MKALTLKHPWPWAICVLGKRIENRRWHPRWQLKVGDWFAIHGGKWPTSKGDLDDVEGEVEDLLHAFRPDEWTSESILDQVKRCSGIVAVCRFGGIVTASPDPWFEGPCGWVLDGLVVLPDPVPCKGAQGLWDLPEDVLAKVLEQWKGVEATR